MCTCTASYSAKSSDKSMKSASVQEANVTATVNGMQRYLEQANLIRLLNCKFHAVIALVRLLRVRPTQEIVNVRYT